MSATTSTATLRRPRTQAPASAPKPSAARERLLATADRLFYAEGIHAVGVDRVITEAQVTRATFYRHFPSKEDLVLAYVEARDAALRSQFAIAAGRTSDAKALLRTIVRGINAQLGATRFRGCPFINVAAEYPDATSPVRQAVAAHRAWFGDTVLELLTAAEHPDPAYATALLVMMRDGTQVAGSLGDRATAQADFQRAAESVIGA